MVDGTVIDGAAIGFLAWALFVIWYWLPRSGWDPQLPQRLRESLFLWLLVFVGAGIAIGWLWP